jgi:hypothetical protein
MSNQQKIDEAISTLEQAMQALKDLGFLTEEDEE